MTAARRQRKSAPFSSSGRPAALVALIGLSLVGLNLAVPLRAATTEQVVANRHTGLAISGFDPVAYFTDGKAVLGKGDFEYAFAGVVWRFRNEGNRGAFADDPDIYMPQFGGYDPVGVARGVGVPGDPRRWLVTGGRLYLFYTAEARDAFADDADRVAALAERNWPAVESTLSP